MRKIVILAGLLMGAALFTGYAGRGLCRLPMLQDRRAAGLHRHSRILRFQARRRLSGAVRICAAARAP